MTADISTRFVRANGIDIHVATAGEGPAILLLHGWPHIWRIWEPVMTRLAEHHRVIAPDLRGIGGARKPRRAMICTLCRTTLRSCSTRSAWSRLQPASDSTRVSLWPGCWQCAT
ncbi:alpha/beta fold hydrolase [Sphingomonas chungangi]|uniref:alpha/beta fold hydrolase n=1 Tax=Sphingomonas chungangi TaxID=2683589 RepID=UPI001C666307|nr:alpha/beta fold hydrolase [Sphingomonas chungangi]